VYGYTDCDSVYVYADCDYELGLSPVNKDPDIDGMYGLFVLPIIPPPAHTNNTLSLYHSISLSLYLSITIPLSLYLSVSLTLSGALCKTLQQSRPLHRFGRTRHPLAL
jgi:hypothetical protein